MKKLGFIFGALLFVFSVSFFYEGFTGEKSSKTGICSIGGLIVQPVYAAPGDKGKGKGPDNKGKGGGKGGGKGKDKDRGPSVPAIPMAAAILIGLAAIGGGAYLLKRKKRQPVK